MWHPGMRVLTVVLPCAGRPVFSINVDARRLSLSDVFPAHTSAFKAPSPTPVQHAQEALAPWSQAGESLGALAIITCWLEYVKS